MITENLPERKREWSQRFTNALELREKRKICSEQVRKAYVPTFVKSNSVTGFVDRERELEPIPYIENHHGSRNSLCSVCNLTVYVHSNDAHVHVHADSHWGVDADVGGTVEETNYYKCDLCPAIAHHACAQSVGKKSSLHTHKDHFTKAYRTHIESQMMKDEHDGAGNGGSSIWCCDLCSQEIRTSIQEERKRLKQDRFKRIAFFSAMKLQASCLRFKAQRRYRVLYNGILRLQARCRGVQIRKSFMTELATTHRAFRIKNCDFELPGIPISDTKSNVSCIVCIVNDESNGLDDSERQMYRFDTHGIAQHNVSGKWNDSFIVYSCNTTVKITLTLHAKEHEQSSARSIFLGQYVVDARRKLTKSFFSGKPFRAKGDLASLDIEPRDQRFSFLKAEDYAKKADTYGRVSFEVHPISNVESKCGIIEEILSAVLQGARKKWHAVLAEKHLHLFSQYGDARPKVTIHLSHGSHVGWYDEKCEIIKLSDLNNQDWLFSCAKAQDLKAWFNKVSDKDGKHMLV